MLRFETHGSTNVQRPFCGVLSERLFVRRSPPTSVYRGVSLTSHYNQAAYDRLQALGHEQAELLRDQVKDSLSDPTYVDLWISRMVQNAREILSENRTDDSQADPATVGSGVPKRPR